jgi:gamma-glutamyltranspeptidase/glutathione hydrolase
MVATSQPLAARAGLSALLEGGSAADAALAAAAMLTVVEPVCTGIGGDAFALVRDAETGTVTALNGSGRAPAAASLGEIRRLMYPRMPRYTAHTVTVPGAVAAWCDLSERYGRMELSRVLEPAIRTAEEGYPVTDWIAATWERQVEKLLRSPGWESGDFTNGPPQESGGELLLDGRAPRVGEVMRLETLAGTLRAIAEGGRDAFYRGDLARRIAEHVQRYGGWLAEEDLAAHTGEWVEPIEVDYRGVTLHECPPNGQGLAAAIAVSLAGGFDLAGMAEPDRLHVQIEAMRLAFADAFAWVADPATAELPLEELLSADFAARRRARIDPERAASRVAPELVPAGDDTVYVSVVDGEGNAVSLIQSLYVGTGSGLVVPGTGISLQNRGAGFSLDAGHPNALAPGKRPYHTIIPAMTTRDGELHACFGVMGGHMQPQAHLQVLSGLVDLGLTPQEALDAPRWQLGRRDRVLMYAPELSGPVFVEDGFAPETLAELCRRGHQVEVMEGFERLRFGGGQIITRDAATGVLTAGSDPRKDGQALGY